MGKSQVQQRMQVDRYVTSIARPSAVLGTTMKRRERGGTLSGSGATSASVLPLPPGPTRLRWEREHDVSRILEFPR